MANLSICFCVFLVVKIVCSQSDYTLETNEIDEYQVDTIRTTQPPLRPRNYRVEVDFQHFDNLGSIRHDGQYCDYLTNCDPHLRSMIDIEKPMLPFPGNALDKDFRNLAVKKDSNGFAVNNKIYRNICHQSVLPSMVTARVDVHDFDTFSNNDLLEQFDCRFPFRPFRNGTDFGDGWSETLQCTAVHQPTRINLSYRWRIVPIDALQCRLNTAVVNIAASSSGNNGQMGRNGPPQDSQDFFGRVYGYIRSAIEFVGDVSKVVRNMSGRPADQSSSLNNYAS